MQNMFNENGMFNHATFLHDQLKCMNDFNYWLDFDLGYLPNLFMSETDWVNLHIPNYLQLH